MTTRPGRAGTRLKQQEPLLPLLRLLLQLGKLLPHGFSGCLCIGSPLRQLLHRALHCSLTLRGGCSGCLSLLGRARPLLQRSQRSPRLLCLLLRSQHLAP